MGKDENFANQLKTFFFHRDLKQRKGLIARPIVPPVLQHISRCQP